MARRRTWAKRARALRWRLYDKDYGYITRSVRWVKRTISWVRYRWRMRPGVAVDLSLFVSMVRRRQYKESVRWDAYLKRDPCVYCYRVTDDMTIEHVVPRSRGGIDSSINKVGCCHACNNGRGSMRLAFYLLKRNGRLPRLHWNPAALRLESRALEMYMIKGPLKTPLGEVARWK
jgi:hypothetical protein